MKRKKNNKINNDDSIFLSDEEIKKRKRETQGKISMLHKKIKSYNKM